MTGLTSQRRATIASRVERAPCVESDWIFAGRSSARVANAASHASIFEARGSQGGLQRSRVDSEAELAQRVRAAAPTRRVLCALAARAVEMRSWSRLGFARAGDQMRERQGMSARSLQELARVHRVLSEAPVVDAAFRTGRIGWTAVRSLARLGRIEDEELWLARARALSRRELERAVCRARAERKAQPVAETEVEDCEAPGDRVPIVCSRLVRAKWSVGRELARRVAGGRLARWECAEVVAAEVSSAVPPGCHNASDLDEDPGPGTWLGRFVSPSRPGAEDAHESWRDAHAAPGLGNRPVSEDPDARDHDGSAAGPETSNASRRPGLPPLSPGLAHLLDGLGEADAFEVDRRLCRALRLERSLEARIGPLLRRVLDGRLYRRHGYWDRDRYIEERLGMCGRKARALVRIERVLQRAPVLAEAYRSARLSWVQMQVLALLIEARVAHTHTRTWVERAERVAVRRLEDDVRAALVLADLDPERFGRTGGVPEEVGMDGWQTGADAKDRQTGADAFGSAEADPGQIGARRQVDEDANISFHAPAESARFFRAVLEQVRQRLTAARGAPATEGEAFEAMLDHAIRVWSERDGSAQRQRRIFERDGWRCAVPGCTSHRNLQLHHIVFRSQGGADEPENLVALCAWHHQRGVHGGVVRIMGRAPDRLRFELGLRDGEPPLVVYDSEERLVGPAHDVRG